MAFCTECGTSITNQVKFCPNCGTKISGIGTPKKSNSNLEKGVAKGLKKNVSNPTSKLKNTVEEKIKERLKQKITNESKEVFKNPKPDSNIDETASTNTINMKYATMYIVANVLVYFFGSILPETQGLIIYSIIIFAIYAIFRRKKEKPINWLLKILLGLQFISVLAILFSYASEGTSIGVLLNGVFALMGASAFLLIIRGNQTK
jgi:uncharacterized Zn finger protein (UPF0148 family)